MSESKDKKLLAEISMVEPTTGVTVSVVIPFPVLPEETTVYQVLKAMAKEGYLDFCDYVINDPEAN